MFDGPEYISYIALCRELELKRMWRTGDYVFYERTDRVALLGEGEDADAANLGIEPKFWLPRLDQWLAMLEEAGFREFRMWPVEGGQWEADWRMDMTNGPDKDRWLVSRPCRTREEAAARLWMAVTSYALPSPAAVGASAPLTLRV